jgi:hypothetical protein
MIAPRDLPPAFAKWNRRWGAPHGRRFPGPSRFRFNRLATRYRGRFAHQSNSQTREYEYPWVAAAVGSCGSALTIIDIGGGLAGMQFVLADEGHDVVNVDPGGRDGSQWGFDPKDHEYLCRAFGASPTLVAETLSDASLPPASADVVMSVSVLEHLSHAELASTARAIRRIVRPDGVVVLTVDLFLDLVPFSTCECGEWGRNVDVRELLELANLELVAGNPEELYGFEQFVPDRVLANEPHYLVSKVRSVAQCLVARPRG